MTLLTLFQAVANGTITPQDAERQAMALMVTVKPLEWKSARFSDKWERVTAVAMFGNYEVLEYSDGGYGMNVTFFDDDMPSLQYDADTIESAKAAAQADYTACILSALTLAPKEDAR